MRSYVGGVRADEARSSEPAEQQQRQRTKKHKRSADRAKANRRQKRLKAQTPGYRSVPTTAFQSQFGERAASENKTETCLQDAMVNGLQRLGIPVTQEEAAQLDTNDQGRTDMNETTTFLKAKGVDATYRRDLRMNPYALWNTLTGVFMLNLKIQGKSADGTNVQDSHAVAYDATAGIVIDNDENLAGMKVTDVDRRDKESAKRLLMKMCGGFQVNVEAVYELVPALASEVYRTVCILEECLEQGRVDMHVNAGAAGLFFKYGIVDRSSGTSRITLQHVKQLQQALESELDSKHNAMLVRYVEKAERALALAAA